MNITTHFNIGDKVHFKVFRGKLGDHFAEGEIRRITMHKSGIRYNIPYIDQGEWCETDRWEDDLIEADAQYWDERCGTCFSNKYYQIKMKGENNEKNHN